MSGRFSAPVFPGDALVVEIWVDDGHVAYRVIAGDRDVAVITGGRATVTP